MYRVNDGFSLREVYRSRRLQEDPRLRREILQEGTTRARAQRTSGGRELVQKVDYDGKQDTRGHR